MDSNTLAFCELVSAGLWNKQALLSQFANVNYSYLLSIAEEQSVIGLVTAGLERVADVVMPKKQVLQFVGSTMQIEQRNMAMNDFVAKLIENLRNHDVYAILVKGQGIAQCYEHPLWRASGDIDLLLSRENYEKAKSYLIPIAASVDEEDRKRQHLAMTIDTFVVELHGTLNGGVSRREKLGLDDVKKDIFEGGRVRSWKNGKTQVFLPNADNDVIIVFTHILEHFFYGGIGLRQVCDWCRLLWTYREWLDLRLLESRIRKMGVMTEWKAFAALAVDYLGMPVEAMPFYSADGKWLRKANKILGFVLETGNFGHNRDYSYQKKYPYLIYKAISFWKHLKDGAFFFSIFPLDSIKVTWRRMVVGFTVVLQGKRHE